MMDRIIDSPTEFAEAAHSDKSSAPPICIPLLLLAGISLLVRFFDLDQNLQRWFWSAQQGWRLDSNAVVQFLYNYGMIPTLVVGSVAALVWIGSKITGRWKQLRPMSIFLALLLVIGPGLIVNALLKDHFGRPRPRTVQAFGGTETFLALGEPNFGGPGKSFPSGHASMGFYWIGLFVFFWNTQRAYAWGFAVMGFTHGLLMGLGRMAQGGHWFSDILWSAGFVYLTAWLLNFFLLRRKPLAENQSQPVTG